METERGRSGWLTLIVLNTLLPSVLALTTYMHLNTFETAHLKIILVICTSTSETSL